LSDANEADSDGGGAPPSKLTTPAAAAVERAKAAAERTAANATGGTRGEQPADSVEASEASSGKRDDSTSQSAIPTRDRGASRNISDPNRPMTIDKGASPQTEAELKRALLASGGKGNYLFTVGLSGRGKSTFQRHLLWYLDRGADAIIGPEHKLLPRHIDSDADLDFNAIKLQWDAEFKDGVFPEPTVRSKVSEFYFQAIPRLWNKSSPLDFGFYEIAGEHFHDIYRSAREGRKPQVRAEIRTFLEDADRNVVIALLANGLNYDDDDSAFATFLQYLRDSPEGRRHYERGGSLALIIAHPEGARQRILTKLARESGFATRREDDPDGWEQELRSTMGILTERHKKEELERRFVNAFFSQTVAEIQLWNAQDEGDKDRARAFFFSVGQIEEIDGVHRIVNPEFNDAKRFYSWMYRRFMGRTLETRHRFREFIRFFARLGGVAGS
jgi:hypothetical protein